MSLRLKLGLILALAVVTAVLAYPREDDILKALHLKGKSDANHIGVRQGLDLQGGAQLVFQADLSKTPAAQKQTAVDSLISVISKRANFGGTSEVIVQRQGSDKVSVSLPGVKDVNEAIDRIGKTADLAFLEVNPSDNTTKPTGIDGKDIDGATADYDPQRAQPVVRLKLKGGDPTKRFGDLTTKMSQTGNLLLTTLDGQPTFGPARTEPITDGTAILSGNLDVKEAKKIADEITAGALPVPVTLVEQRSVGPTLGRESVRASIVAGVIGLGVVAVFMLAYYRLAGLLAVLALIIYTTITLSLYKLSVFLPGYTIVLTLAGIAGFILSIGMAVDANILIFERMKEELRAGKSFVAAVEAAFDRAWTSIRDSNVSTLITCTILFLTSSATPIIRGFAVTLGLGVLVSLFTAVIVTRTLLRLVIRQGWGRNASWYGVKPVEEVK
jgi:preprotein translocase subunit SecD